MNEGFMNSEEFEKAKVWAKAWLDEQERRDNLKAKEKKEKEKRKNLRNLIMRVSIYIMAALMLYQVYSLFTR